MRKRAIHLIIVNGDKTSFLCVILRKRMENVSLDTPGSDLVHELSFIFVQLFRLTGLIDVLFPSRQKQKQS